MIVRVECHAGHRGEQTPRRIAFDGLSVELLDSWLAPDHRYFKMRGADGATYILRHDGPSDRWEIPCTRRQDALPVTERTVASIRRRRLGSGAPHARETP
jgi:hypothetical protein